MNLKGIHQIGIVGGGVSALMLCIEAAKLGIRTTLLDPKIDCIGAQIATEHMVATINSENIQKLSLRADLVIFNRNLDFELNIKLHSKTYPSKAIMNELSSPKNILDLLEILEIPTAKVYYQDNKEDVCHSLEGVALPFRFIKQYAGYSRALDVKDKEDLMDFIAEVDETADSFIIQPITTYEHTLTCLCMVDRNGKVYLYDPLEATYEAEKVCSLKVATCISKTMSQKIGRYNRKLLKELQGEGVFTIKYGIKANKGIEFISISPEVDVAGILTLEAFDTSIYEQYMHMLLEMPILAPTLESYAEGTIKPVEEKMDKGTTYHMYNLGLTNMCITRNSNKS